MAKQPDSKTAPVVQHEQGRRVIALPEGLTYKQAAMFCAAKAQEQEAMADTARTFECLPWSGAFALQTLLTREYSATYDGNNMTAQTARGPVSVAIPGDREVGTWTIAGLGSAYVSRVINAKRNAWAFRVVVRAQRQRQADVDTLLEALRLEIEKRELYSGCALLLEPDGDGDIITDRPMAVMALPSLTPNDIVLAEETRRVVNAEVFTPILQSERLEALGMQTRRGVLLSGLPGTGKTLTARIAASMALAKGWTVFYLGDARALEQGIAIAQAHSPALLVCEDIDRHLGRERDEKTDRILNALSGMDQSARLVLLCTSNDPSRLPAAMLRPGRLDSLIPFPPPDAFAAAELLSLYLPANHYVSLPECGEACAGMLSASIREVVARAQLHALTRGADIMETADVLSAAQSVRAHEHIVRLAERDPAKAPIPAVRLLVSETVEPGDIIGADTQTLRGFGLLPG